MLINTKKYLKKKSFYSAKLIDTIKKIVITPTGIFHSFISLRPSRLLFRQWSRTFILPLTQLIWHVSDPVVDSWLFMKSPVPVIIILVSYLYFVLKLGPQLMANRPPFQLKGLIIAYNAYQVVFSLWLCGQVFKFKSDIHLLGQSCRNATHSDIQRIVSRPFLLT